MNRNTAAPVIACAAIALALGACSSTSTYGDKGGVKLNKTTIAQAEKMYGAPTKTRYSPDGSETWTWEDQNMAIKFMDGVAIDTMMN